jgi:hypothetical protein
VNPLTTFVSSLGNAGALANAQAALDARRDEDWLVRGLVNRLEHPDASRARAAVASETAA